MLIGSDTSFVNEMLQQMPWQALEVTRCGCAAQFGPGFFVVHAMVVAQAKLLELAGFCGDPQEEPMTIRAAGNCWPVPLGRCPST